MELIEVIKKINLLNTNIDGLYGDLSARALLKFLINVDAGEEIIEVIYKSKNTYSFANGTSGVNWLVRFIQSKYDVFYEKDLKVILEEDFLVKKYAIQYLENLNYDFLHGSLGMAYYLLYDKDEIDLDFFKSIFERLETILLENKGVIYDYYFIKTLNSATNQVNFGLAHGYPSIIKFCVESYKKGVCVKSAKEIACTLIKFMLQNTNKDKSFSYFSNTITISETAQQDSRLAWCYGDLGIGFIFYQASLVFEDKELGAFSLKILHHCAKRRSFEATIVKDAGICHGSSGIAHIFNKMWHYTQNEIFKEACDFWIQKSLNYGIEENGVIEYKKYNNVLQQYEICHSLLEGNAGVGLVLYSYETGDFSWDYCLMLND